MSEGDPEYVLGDDRQCPWCTDPSDRESGVDTRFRHAGWWAPAWERRSEMPKTPIRQTAAYGQRQKARVMWSGRGKNSTYGEKNRGAQKAQSINGKLSPDVIRGTRTGKGAGHVLKG